MNLPSRQIPGPGPLHTWTPSPKLLEKPHAETRQDCAPELLRLLSATRRDMQTGWTLTRRPAESYSDQTQAWAGRAILSQAHRRRDWKPRQDPTPPPLESIYPRVQLVRYVLKLQVFRTHRTPGCLFSQTSFHCPPDSLLAGNCPDMPSGGIRAEILGAALLPPSGLWRGATPPEWERHPSSLPCRPAPPEPPRSPSSQTLAPRKGRPCRSRHDSQDDSASRFESC